MPNSSIFLLQDDDNLVEMSEQDYDSERVLQELLAKYPNLLAGETTSDGDRRQWLLIKREMSIPSEDDAAGRWSIDHLFVDQDAVPTLVEVKRSTDTRIRREVVGQMLDYAANAVVYWSLPELRTQFESTCDEDGRDADQELADLLGDEGEQDEFWERLKTNLRAGKIRMVFVADRIPQELRRIVEFLNEQMDQAEVLAIEIKQYVGEGMKTLVPRLVGQTASSQTKKRGGRSTGATPSDEAAFFQRVQSECSAEDAIVAQKVIDWLKEQQFRLDARQGGKRNSIWVVASKDGKKTVSVNSHGFVTFPLSRMKRYCGEELRRAMVRRLDEIPGVELPPDSHNRLPSVPYSALTNPKSLDEFFRTLEWFQREIASSEV